MFVAKWRWDVCIEMVFPFSSSIHTNFWITKVFLLLGEDQGVCDVSSNRHFEDFSDCNKTIFSGIKSNAWNHSSVVYIGSFFIDVKQGLGRDFKCLKQINRIPDDNHYDTYYAYWAYYTYLLSPNKAYARIWRHSVCCTQKFSQCLLVVTLFSFRITLLSIGYSWSPKTMSMLIINLSSL